MRPGVATSTPESSNRIDTLIKAQGAFILKKRPWPSDCDTGVVEEKIFQVLKNMPPYEKSPPVDRQRKEHNWEQIQQKLRRHRGMDKAHGPELSRSVGHSERQHLGQRHPAVRRSGPESTTLWDRTSKLLPTVRTGAAAVVGLAVVAYAAYMLENSGLKPTDAHSKTRGAVHQQSNLPAGVTVTNLSSPSINPGNELQGNMSDVSPNGDWMIVQQPGGQPVLRSVSELTKITLPSGEIKIYCQTPDGSLILGVVTGGIIGRFNPATGSITKLPSSTDSSAHWTYAAAESVTGYWAMTVGNSNTAMNHRWVNVDGHKVSSLQSTSKYAWSPAGNMLAAIVSSSHSGAVTSSTVITEQLVLYNATTGKTETPKATVLSNTPSNSGQSGQVKTGSTWHAPQQINGVFNDGSALVVGIGGPSAGGAIGSGKVLSLVGTHATTIVSKSADYWWYDEMNHHIYFYVQDGSGSLIGHVMTKDASLLEGQSS